MTGRLLKLALGSAVAVLLGTAVLFFTFADPFNWGVVVSSRFTWGKFAEVKTGEEIQTVIERLGDPIQEPNPFSVLTTNPSDPCIHGDCVEYFFAGANFGVSHREAIVITDRNGRVVHAEARQE